MFAAKIAVWRQSWVRLTRALEATRILDLLESSGLSGVVQVRRVGLLYKVCGRWQKYFVVDRVEER